MKVKSLLLLVTCVLLSFLAEGKSMKGYRITLENDTLWGEVKAYKINQVDNTFLVNGIDLERYHIEFFFKELHQLRSKRHTTEDTQEFGFSYDGQEYVFTRFDLEKNSLSKKSRNRPRFLQLTYSGEVKLYENRIRLMENPTTQAFHTKTQSMVYPELYLYTKELGLQQVVKTKETPNVKTFLSNYGISPGFLKEIPDDYPFADIQTLLMKYDKEIRGTQKQL